VSVTAAAGFRAAGVAAGLKGSGRPDVALVVNDGPDWAAAGVFTRNRVQAAPVLWSRQVLRGGSVRAVVLNSGGANACTGPAGFADTHRTAEAVGAALQVSGSEVAVCSTGLIGVPLVMPALLSGVAEAAASVHPSGGADAAEAIRTTDSVRKQAESTVDGVTVGGMAKGAGMLAPSLATMLAVITTDALADPLELDQVLRAAAAGTFERVDADGCLSTNDTVLLLASGASGIRPSTARLTEQVETVCTELAGQLVRDAEGASKTVRIDVIGAAGVPDALAVARAVARNSLLKCALAGSDPNWGRVLAAVGTTDAVFEPDRLGVWMNGVKVCRAGAAYLDRSTVDLSGREVTITVDLAAGSDTAFIYTTDFTEAYVHENSAYST